MPLTTKKLAKDIDGLLPAIDFRQPGKIFCMDGKNFKWTVQGPESSFGSRYIGNEPIDDPEFASTFRLTDTIIYSGAKSFYQYDPVSMTFYPLYFFGTQADKYPWSFCQILNKYYFCRKGLGVFEFNPVTNHWRKLTPTGLPTDPVGICEVRGRLIVLGSDFYGWSAIENADDFTPSIATGAGFQALSIIGGIPLGIFEASDGFNVYTSKGIVAAQYSDNQAVFRHIVLTREHKAINPFCIVELDEGLQLFCDKKGFFQTSGNKPEPFNPLFSEYINQTLLETRDLGDFSVFRMHHAKDQRLLFFMVCLSSNSTIYEKSWCLHIPTDKWGSFDKLHYGFGELNLGSGSFFDFNFGFIDENGYFHRFTEEAFNEVTERPETGYFYHTDFDMPSRRMEDVYFFTTIMNGSAETESDFVGFDSGFYDYGIIEEGTFDIDDENDIASEMGDPIIFKSDMTAAFNSGTWAPFKTSVDQESLAAYVKFGLFRFDELKNDDQLGEILSLSVHSGPIPGSEEDWLTASGEEDFLTSTLPDEDWGFGVDSGDDYDLILTGTTDGKTIYLDHQYTLNNIANSNERVRRYPGNMCKGIFHDILINALGDNQTFHIKTLEVSGFGAGRIN